MQIPRNASIFQKRSHETKIHPFQSLDRQSKCYLCHFVLSCVMSCVVSCAMSCCVVPNAVWVGIFGRDGDFFRVSKENHDTPQVSPTNPWSFFLSVKKWKYICTGKRILTTHLFVGMLQSKDANLAFPDSLTCVNYPAWVTTPVYLHQKVVKGNLMMTCFCIIKGIRLTLHDFRRDRKKKYHLLSDNQRNGK